MFVAHYGVSFDKCKHILYIMFMYRKKQVSYVAMH